MERKKVIENGGAVDTLVCSVCGKIIEDVTKADRCDCCGELVCNDCMIEVYDVKENYMADITLELAQQWYALTKMRSKIKYMQRLGLFQNFNLDNYFNFRADFAEGLAGCIYNREWR